MTTEAVEIRRYEAEQAISLVKNPYLHGDKSPEAQVASLIERYEEAPSLDSLDMLMAAVDVVRTVVECDVPTGQQLALVYGDEVGL